MLENKPDTESDWIDPDDDGLEWTDEMFDAAEYSVGGIVIRPATGAIGPDGTIIRLTPVTPGRPKLDDPKQQVTLRLDGIVLERFRATGPGWQTRINEALRKAVGV